MSLRIRVASYIGILLASNNQGLRYDQLVEGVKVLEGCDFLAETDVCYGMAFKSKPPKEIYFLNQYEPNKFYGEQYKDWIYIDGKYYSKNDNKLDNESERLVDGFIEKGLEKDYYLAGELGSKICQYFIEKSHSNGLSFDNLVNKILGLCKENDRDYCERVVTKSLALKGKPVRECYYLDQKDLKKDSLEEYYPRFRDWYFENNRYFIPNLSKTLNIFNNKKLINQLNENLTKSIRNTLSEELSVNAKKNNWNVHEYLRNFAYMFANIKAKGIDFRMIFNKDKN